MKVLFAASEGTPFAKSGGLADVIGSLPKAMRELGVDARVVLPKYEEIPDNFRHKMKPIYRTTVPVGWRNQYCGVEYLEYNGVPFYFIDNEYYFKRPGLYGYGDEAERYAFFCRAVLEIIPHINFKPHVIHSHDWHTGMVSPLLKAHYSKDPFYKGMGTVFTIHNLRYQGVFPREVLADLLDLDDSYFTADKLEFYGKVNFMKGGVVFSDVINTVSKSYAEEIKTPYFGENLDGLLSYRSKDLYGIVNGIDYSEFNPYTDPHIFYPYDSKSLEIKAKNKMELQRNHGLPVSEKIPLTAIISRLTSQKGIDLIARVLEEILSMEGQLIVLGAGDEQYEHLFKDAAWRHPDKLAINIMYDEKLAHQIYSGADLILMPSQFEPCGLGQLIAMSYGTIPIVRETGGLKDTVVPYNEQTGEGNGFTFTNYNAHDMLYTIERAYKYYQQPVWKKLQEKTMSIDYSWKESAKQYQELYQKTQ